MAERDPYRLLGVGSDASDEEVRAAFRRAVRESHPDTASGDLGDRDVQSVIDAYHLLIDPARRARYDEARDRAFGSSGGRAIDVTRRASRGRRGRAARRTSVVRCSGCGGAGVLSSVETCPSCRGRAVITAIGIETAGVVRCRTCRGRGRVRSDRVCGRCDGNGVVGA